MENTCSRSTMRLIKLVHGNRYQKGSITIRFVSFANTVIYLIEPSSVVRVRE